MLGKQLNWRNETSHQEQILFDKVGGSKILFTVFLCLRHLPFAANTMHMRDGGNSGEMGLLTAFLYTFFFASHHSHQHSMGKKTLNGKLLCCLFPKLTCTEVIAVEEEGDQPFQIPLILTSGVLTFLWRHFSLAVSADVYMGSF